MRCSSNVSLTYSDILWLPPKYTMASISHQMFRAVRLTFMVLRPGVSTKGLLTEGGRHFQRLFHVNKLHIHFVGTPKQCRALPARDAASAKAGSVCECESLAVGRVKGLDFESDLFGLRQERDAAICHRAIHVHEKHFNLCSTFPERWKYKYKYRKIKISCSA